MESQGKFRLVWLSSFSKMAASCNLAGRCTLREWVVLIMSTGWWWTWRKKKWTATGQYFRCRPSHTDKASRSIIFQPLLLLRRRVSLHFFFSCPKEIDDYSMIDTFDWTVIGWFLWKNMAPTLHVCALFKSGNLHKKFACQLTWWTGWRTSNVIHREILK